MAQAEPLNVNQRQQSLPRYRKAGSRKASPLSSNGRRVPIYTWQLRQTFIKTLGTYPRRAEFNNAGPLGKLQYELACELFRQDRKALRALVRLLEADVYWPDKQALEREEIFELLVDPREPDNVLAFLAAKEPFFGHLISPSSRELFLDVCYNHCLSEAKGVAPLAWYSLAILLEPLNSAAYIDLCHEETIPLVTKEHYIDAWLSAQPEHITALLYKAGMLAKRQEYAAAIALSSATLEITDRLEGTSESINTVKAWVLVNRGDIYNLADQKEMALADYKLALALAPDTPEFARLSFHVALLTIILDGFNEQAAHLVAEAALRLSDDPQVGLFKALLFFLAGQRLEAEGDIVQGKAKKTEALAAAKVALDWQGTEAELARFLDLRLRQYSQGEQVEH